MCRKFLAFRELDDVLVYILERIPGIGNDAGFLDKIIHAKRREKLRRTVGRKHMIRSRKVVAERLGGIFADKDCSGVADLRHHLKRILRHKFQVLGRNLIDRCNRIVQTVGNQNVSVILQRFCDDLLSRQLLHKSVNLCRYLPGKRAACGNQDSRSHLVMLRLRQ